jgi:hypothetical protein
MIRHCDGADPNLIQYVTPDGDRTDDVLQQDRERRKPCDCGRVFNDVRYMTIWPHRAV